MFKKESEYQILKRAHAMIGSKSQVTWQEVTTNIMKTKPECQDSCPLMFQFLTQLTSQNLLDELDQRVMKQMTASKPLGPDFWMATSKDAKGACGALLRTRTYAIGLACPSWLVFCLAFGILSKCRIFRFLSCSPCQPGDVGEQKIFKHL